MERRLTAILAADVAGYSRMMGADEAGTLALLKQHRSELVDRTIAAHRGHIVKLTGDGMLVEFRSVVDALGCAAEIQRGMRERNAGVPEKLRIEFRMGINVGDIIIEDDDIYGEGVNIAARLESIARPGGIAVSASVRDSVGNKVDVVFEDAGEQMLKNIERPVRVFNIAGLGASARAGSAGAEVITSAVEKSSIAVLAFNNMSGDAEQEYFSDGISEDIITDLSKLSDVHVIARNSSFVYKGKSVSVPDVAKTLGVRYVLEGSVRRAGAKVRVTAQLIDSQTGGHVWANRFDRDLTDIFAVQDELTREIVAALAVKLNSGERDRMGRKAQIDVAAYQLFLRGRERSLLSTQGANIEARDLLSAAIAIVDDYAAAHAQIAFTHAVDFLNGWSDDPRRSLDLALAGANHAIAMDADEAQGYFALTVASLWNRDLEGALSASDRCLALAPNSAEGHLARAHTEIFLGRPASALATLDKYMRLDPLFPAIALYFLAEAHFGLGEYDKTIAALERRLARDSQSETSYALLASSLGHLGRAEEARKAWARVFEINPGFSVERRRKVLPFRNPEHFERRVEGVRKAGISI
jgi:adenylate cyclase